MTKFVFHINPERALLLLPVGTTAQFTLDDASHLTGVHPQLVLYYSRLGLVPLNRSARTGQITFDAEALQEIRRIEYYRRHLGIGRRALPLICALRRDAERQHIELKFLGRL
jgi:DNA-binding transcriptional MerR regulator